MLRILAVANVAKRAASWVATAFRNLPDGAKEAIITAVAETLSHLLRQFFKAHAEKQADSAPANRGGADAQAT